MRIGQIITVIADRKFGFIRSEHFRDDVFFHFSTLENLNPKWLRIGQDVEFEIDELLRQAQASAENAPPSTPASTAATTAGAAAPSPAAPTSAPTAPTPTPSRATRPSSRSPA